MSRSRALGAMVLLLTLVLPIQSSRAARPAWDAAASTGTLVLPSGELALDPQAAPAARAYGAFSHFGLFDSQPRAGAAFRRARVDWQASAPAGSEVRLAVRVADAAGRWSDWEIDVAPGAVVSFDRVAARHQYRLTLLGTGPQPRVSHVAVAPLPLSDDDLIRGSLQERIAPTYHIRATRMGLVGDRTANGHIIKPNDWFVSLPSFRSLSSKGGSEYMARLSYRGTSIVVPVWEVGPWNIRDDYWNVNRERFADLPVGWPQDHAAFFDGYNGGWAEKGRVRFPTAADVGDGAWVALGIPFKDEQEELDITFLWLGADPGPNPAPLQPGQQFPGPAAAPAPAAPAPADESGAIVVDNLNAGFARSEAPWYEWKCGQGGHAFWTYSTPKKADSTNVAAWSAELPAGSYEVKAFVPFCKNGKADTRSAVYVVRHAGGQASVKVNQAANAGEWVSLGTFAFDGSGAVELSDLTGDSMRSVWFDAVKWIPAGH